MAATLDLQPLFPLPNVVLFPKGVLALHVFEPRYRTMMADVLKGDQTLCMALLKPGWEADYHGSPEVYGVACVGRVVQHHLLEGGRYNVTLRGEAKVAIEGIKTDQPYRVARVREIEEDRSWVASRDVQDEVAELLTLFRRARLGENAALDMAQAYPDAACALTHDNPFQLLVATILSAQCTDARVNMVTPDLFRKYPDALTM